MRMLRSPFEPKIKKYRTFWNSKFGEIIELALFSLGIYRNFTKTEQKLQISKIHRGQKIKIAKDIQQKNLKTKNWGKNF